MYNVFNMAAQEEKAPQNRDTTAPPQKESEQQPAQVGPQTQPPPPPEPEKDLFSWRAPARPFKRRDREFWITIIAIAGIFGLVLFLVEGVMPVILIISIVFLFYVLSTVEPAEIEYKISNKGVKVAEKRNDWETISRFWFTKRFDNDLLVFEVMTLPGRLELVFNLKDKDNLKNVISKYVPEEEAAPSGLDRASNWFASKLPGNK